MEPEPELPRPAIKAKHNRKHIHAKMEKGDVKKPRQKKSSPAHPKLNPFNLPHPFMNAQHSEESLEKLTKLLNRVAGKDPSTIRLSSRLNEDLELESLEMMELLFEAEDEFGLKIEIPTESLADIKTVEDMLNALQPKQ
ncbi:MAG: acyl carrier protein [Cyanobacteria bacterium]|nr:acyl carrier protein [Cyanobacteriota bacterium]